MIESAHACNCAAIDEPAKLINVTEATQIARRLVTPLSRTDLVRVTDCLGRVAAKDLYAPIAMPFFDNSAMDGYAVKTALFVGDGPWTFPVCKTIAAGDAPSDCKTEGSDEAVVRIFTGAPLPPKFDAVVAQENVTSSDGQIVFHQKPNRGLNIRQAGSDMERGALLVSAGTALGSHHVGLLAANGYSAINVLDRLKIAVLSTGNELSAPGELAKPGQIYDCNLPMLAAQLEAVGAKVTELGVVPDSLGETVNLIGQCKNRFDMIISSGSVSVGGKDYLKEALLQAGGQIANWKVAVKPGKPVMFGKLGDTVFTGLPGNPFAAYVGFSLFVKPQIDAFYRKMAEPFANVPARAGFSWQRRPGRAEIFPVKLAGYNENGAAVLLRLGRSVSATLYPLANADGLAMVSADTTNIESGDPVNWQPFCNGRIQ